MVNKMIPMQVNLPLLRDQKNALMRAMEEARPDDKELLGGILNLLDHVHDHVDPPAGAALPEVPEDLWQVTVRYDDPRGGTWTSPPESREDAHARMRREAERVRGSVQMNRVSPPGGTHGR